jgi:hypothetical protein
MRPLKAFAFCFSRSKASLMKGWTWRIRCMSCGSGFPSASRPTIVRGTSYTPRSFGSAVDMATPVMALTGKPLIYLRGREEGRREGGRELGEAITTDNKIDTHK